MTGARIAAEARAFWTRLMEAVPSPASLPVARPSGSAHAGSARPRWRTSSVRLGRFADRQGWQRHHNVSAESLCLAAWAGLISRYADQEDVVIGAGWIRESGEAAGRLMVVPLRTRVPHTEPLEAWVPRLSADLATARRLGDALHDAGAAGSCQVK